MYRASASVPCSGDSDKANEGLSGQIPTHCFICDQDSSCITADYEQDDDVASDPMIKAKSVAYEGGELEDGKKAGWENSCKVESHADSVTCRL